VLASLERRTEMVHRLEEDGLCNGDDAGTDEVTAGLTVEEGSCIHGLVRVLPVVILALILGVIANAWIRSSRDEAREEESSGDGMVWDVVRDKNILKARALEVAHEQLFGEGMAFDREKTREYIHYIRKQLGKPEEGDLSDVSVEELKRFIKAPRAEERKSSRLITREIYVGLGSAVCVLVNDREILESDEMLLSDERQCVVVGMIRRDIGKLVYGPPVLKEKAEKGIIYYTPPKHALVVRANSAKFCLNRSDKTCVIDTGDIKVTLAKKNEEGEWSWKSEPEPFPEPKAEVKATKEYDFSRKWYHEPIIVSEDRLFGRNDWALEPPKIKLDPDANKIQGFFIRLEPSQYEPYQGNFLTNERECNINLLKTREGCPRIKAEGKVSVTLYEGAQCIVRAGKVHADLKKDKRGMWVFRVWTLKDYKWVEVKKPAAKD